MNRTGTGGAPNRLPRGFEIGSGTAGEQEAIRRQVLVDLARIGLADAVRTESWDGAEGYRLSFTLRDDATMAWAPGLDTTGLCQRMRLDSWNRAEDLEREIWVGLLLAPIPFVFPGCQELAAAIRMRRYVVEAGRMAVLAFETDAAERPTDFWTYAEDTGFTLRSGGSLATALRQALEPDASGRPHSFSCYRATEYVLLLALARELKTSNRALLETLESRMRKRAIVSGEFHEIFLREYGSMQEPLPPGYYVPGDRVWFRNPDERSADVVGFSGSWVFYLGNGLFTNFWRRDDPFTLASKCVEIYHWRDGVVPGPNGEPRMDEDRVAQHVARTMADPDRLARVLGVMMRYREPRGVYGTGGGCIDSTREFVRWVCAGTSDIVIPDQEPP